MLNLKTPCCKLKIRRLGAKLCLAFLLFKSSYDVLKSKSPCSLLNKNINFNINETESKTEDPTHSFRETNHISSHQNSKLNEKLWWVGTCERKEKAFLVPFIFSKENFFPKEICVLSQCIVYWIHFQNIHSLHIVKHCFILFCCLFLKLSKAFSVSLNVCNFHTEMSWFCDISFMVVPSHLQIEN